MTRLHIIGAVICLLTSTVGFTADEEIYKWVNAKGQVNYGSHPPVGVKAELITTLGGPSDSEVQEAQMINDAIQKATSSGPTKTAESPAEIQAKKEACDRAQQEYKRIANAPKIATKNEQGELEKMDAAGQQAMIQEKQEAANKACAP